MNKNQTFALNWKKNSEKLDLCIKLEKITNRTFALNWKTKLKKITSEEEEEERKKEGKSRNQNLPKFSAN